MTIKDTLALYGTIESDLLLAFILKKPKEFLFLHPEKHLTTEQRKEFKQLAKRRLKGEPFAYIVGYKYFCGLKFLINKHVLIPRPETEWLVEQATQIIKNKLNQTVNEIKVLDMGTGSGCIAVSLAKHFAKQKRVQLTASDVSVKALAVAKQNAKQHKVKINFVQSNLFQRYFGRFDVVIANLPYIPLKDYKKLKATLRFEPALALHDKTNSFVLYKKFLKQLPDHLRKNAVVLLETDPGSKGTLPLPKSHRWYKDLRGLWRYVIIKN